MKVLFIPLAAVAIAAGGAAHAPGKVCPGLCVIRTFRLPPGHITRAFAFHTPSVAPVRVNGNTEIVRPVYADSAELTATSGTVVSVRATQGEMYIASSTRPWQSLAMGIGCRHEDGVDVCTDAFEHCAPAEPLWRATIRKKTEAPAFVRVEFVFAAGSG